MEYIFSIITKATGLSPQFQKNIIISLVIIVTLSVTRFIALRIVWSRVSEVKTRYMWQKSLLYTTVVLGILLVGRVWFTGFQSLATFLGLLSAGLAIALKDIVTNMAGWAFIILRRPLILGDRIRILEHSGDVIDIRLFLFTIMEIGKWVDAEQSTGRIIHIPNGRIFTETLTNYSQGFKFIWNEVPVLITFESNWQKAKGILQEVADTHGLSDDDIVREKIKEASKKYLIFYSKLTPTVYTSVLDNGVLLTIRHLCRPKNRREIKQAIWEDILKHFAECHDIEFAYPTVRVYNNAAEGKDGPG